jgi:hypothetical protein
MRAASCARHALACICFAALAGCASVTSGLSQSVTVTPVCEGTIRKASCELANDKGRWQLEAPGSVTLQKAYGDLTVTCVAGAAQGKATFVSKPNDNVYGNILVGGLVGFAVDSASGAGYRYPDELAVVVTPPCE